MRTNRFAKFAIVIFVAALVLSIFSEIFILRFHYIQSGMDSIANYHLMKTSYSNKKLPTMGAYLEPIEDIEKENIDAARTPGGYFLIEYIWHFIVSRGDYYRARISYAIVMLIAAIMFLAWIYIHFGVITASIVAGLLLVSDTFLGTSSSFANPHPTLMLSFLFLPILAEYVRDKYESLIPSVLLFPILTLMWQSHFAVFFSMIVTLIVYLAINWERKTKYNIKGLSIGLGISFLAYLPYLIGEIRSGFSNTKLILSRKESISESLSSLFHLPKIHNVLLFPTNKSNATYNSIETFFDYWIFNYNIETRIYFIFYILSALFILMAVIISLKDYFRNRNAIIKPLLSNDKNKNMLKEMLYFFMLYFVVTLVSYNIFGLGSGRVEHFYNAYALSFVPIIYFVEYLKLYRSRLLKYIMIFVFINMFALTARTYIQNRKHTPYDNFYLIGNALQTIIEDSNGRYFNFDTTSDKINTIAKAYYGIENWKTTSNRNAILKYIFVNANIDYTPSIDEKLIFESKYHKIYKIEQINNQL